MATRNPTGREKKIYEAITAGKKGYGVYHKSCFHLHTPASHDYRFLKIWTEKDYKAASDEAIYRLCIEKKVLPSNFDFDMVSLSDFPAFNSKKELLSYLALADPLRLLWISYTFAPSRKAAADFPMWQSCFLKRRKA